MLVALYYPRQHYTVRSVIVTETALGVGGIIQLYTVLHCKECNSDRDSAEC